MEVKEWGVGNRSVGSQIKPGDVRVRRGRERALHRIRPSRFHVWMMAMVVVLRLLSLRRVYRAFARQLALHHRLFFAQLLARSLFVTCMVRAVERSVCRIVVEIRGLLLSAIAHGQQHRRDHEKVVRDTTALAL